MKFGTYILEDDKSSDMLIFFVKMTAKVSFKQKSVRSRP